jgi:hypothetical protein
MKRMIYSTSELVRLQPVFVLRKQFLRMEFCKLRWSQEQMGGELWSPKAAQLKMG